MARKIAVENSREHLKKSVASLLVRRLVAEWVIPGVMIRRLTIVIVPVDVRSVRRPHAAGALPKRMPPAEVGGCRFRGPRPNPESDIRQMLHLPGDVVNHSREYLNSIESASNR